MILFLEDWNKYPDAVADLSTKNESFIRIAALYKSMGVDNHAFPLALHNQELSGLDPFSADLSREEMIAIAAECKLNPWYFFREVVRVPAGSGEGASYLQANRGNIALFWYFFNHCTVFLTQIRQTGKSLNSDILDCYLLGIRCTNTTINLLTKDDALRSVNIQRIKDIFSELPWYLNQRTKKDLDNTEIINIGNLKNWYRTSLPQKSPKLALNVGRGFTSAIFKCDEGPFSPNSRISIPAALAAGTDARDRARRAGEPYGTVFTSTAGKKDDPDGRFYYLELCSAATHTEKYYDCKNEAELEKTIKQASRTNTRLFKNEEHTGGEYAVNITLNHRQLGKTDEWLARAIRESKANGDDANRDFFNVWTSGTLKSPFSPADADKIRKSEMEPFYIQFYQKEGYTVRWYMPKEKIDEVFRNNKIIIGVDTSDASGGDDIGLSGYIDKTGQTLFSCNINITNLLVFFDWFAQEWIINRPNTIIIIERKSSGVTLIDNLLLILPKYDIDPFKRLFNRVVNEKELYISEYSDISRAYNYNADLCVKLKKHFGFATSSGGITSRSDLYSTTLGSAVRLVGDVVYDKTTIDQLLGLVQKNSRVDHAPGEHDDMVMSWLLAHWLMTQGRNLYHYDLTTSELFSRITSRNDIKQTEDITSVKNQLQTLITELKETNDYFIAERKEHEIKVLRSRMPEETRHFLSVDDLLEKAKEDRKKRLQVRRDRILPGMESDYWNVISSFYT